MQPKRVREMNTVSEIRSWFEDADVNGDGTVSINEFFIVRASRARGHARSLISTGGGVAERADERRRERVAGDFEGAFVSL